MSENYKLLKKQLMRTCNNPNINANREFSNGIKYWCSGLRESYINLAGADFFIMEINNIEAWRAKVDRLTSSADWDITVTKGP